MLLLLAACTTGSLTADDPDTVTLSWRSESLEACTEAGGYAMWDLPQDANPVALSVQRVHADGSVSWISNIAADETGRLLVNCEDTTDEITVTYAVDHTD